MFFEACFGQIRFRTCFVLLDMLSIVLFVFGDANRNCYGNPGMALTLPPRICVRWKLKTTELPQNYNSIIKTFFHLQIIA